MNTVLDYLVKRVPDAVARYDKAFSGGYPGDTIATRERTQLRKLARGIAAEVLKGTPVSTGRETVNKFLRGPGQVLNGDGKSRSRAQSDPDPFQIMSKAFWSKCKDIGGM